MPIFVTLIYTVKILSNINEVTIKPISCTEKSFVLKYDFFFTCTKIFHTSSFQTSGNKLKRQKEEHAYLYLKIKGVCK